MTTASADSVAAGGSLGYTMTVVNTGPDAARDVVINDWPDLGQLVGPVTCVASGGATCPGTLASRMTVPVLPVGGRLQFGVASTVPSFASGPISNRARVSAAGDPNHFNDSDTVGAVAVYVAPTSANAVDLQSDAGDFIGLGESHVYTPANAKLTVAAVGSQLHVAVDGDQKWTADFALPNALSQLQPGTYTNLTRTAFDDPAVGGLDWHGEARGCNEIAGTIVVNSASYVAGQLSGLDLTSSSTARTGLLRCAGTSAGARPTPRRRPARRRPRPASGRPPRLRCRVPEAMSTSRATRPTSWGRAATSSPRNRSPTRRRTPCLP